MSSAPVRYVYALVRDFASDTSSGGRDRIFILGSDGSELSWDGDRIRVVEGAAQPQAKPDRITRYVDDGVASFGLQVA